MTEAFQNMANAMEAVTTYCYNHWQRNVISDRLLEQASILRRHQTLLEADNAFATHMHSISKHCTLKGKKGELH